MRLSEELLVLAPVLGLVALLPLFYWRKVLRCRWVSIFGINLTKEWHKPNKTQAAHGRCQGRTEVIRMFQKDERSSFPIQPLDDLDHKLTSMEDATDGNVQPCWTPWLCIVVFWEMLQFMAVPFASRVQWDRESDWKIVPDGFGLFLPNPADQRVYDLTTWIILAPLYLAAFCICWLLFLGVCLRHLPRLKIEGTHEYLGQTFVALLTRGRWIFVSAKETFFDFGSLFIMTGIIRSLFNSEGRLESYWPSSLILLVVYYGALVWSDEGTNSVIWIHNLVRFFSHDRYPYFVERLPKNDDFYFQRMLRALDNQDLRRLHLYVASHQRPTFASRWTLLSSTSKLIIAVLFVFAHFEEFWAWMLLSVSSLLFVMLLYESLKYGPCSFQWINVFRNIGMISALWGNLCGVLAQGRYRLPDITYSSTPTLVFMVGLAVILGSAPFCIAVSRRLFIWSPFRLHHLKLPVVHFYYKLVALGRIMAIKDSLNSEGVVFRTDLNTMLQNIRFEQRLGTEQTSSARNLMINHELWVAWVKKNTQFFRAGHVELSMQDKINVCSKKSLAQCVAITEDCAELQTLQKIKKWMREAEMVIDPEMDVELGLRVPDDEYLSFADGVPIFTGDEGPRVFSEESLRKINIAVNNDTKSDASIRSHRNHPDRFGSGDHSSIGSVSLCPPSSHTGEPQRKSWASTPSVQQPFHQESSERPNQIGSVREIISSESLETIARVLGLVRHPFSREMPHEELPLHSMLRLSDPNAKRCYLSSNFFRSVYQRCLVDEYHRREDDTLHLTLSSIPLLSYLERNGFTFTFLPHSDFVEGDDGKGFEFNVEAANDNAFMSGVDLNDHHTEDAVGRHPTGSDLTTTALHEFHGLHRMLTESVGIQAHVFEQDPLESTPDAVFPNNWLTTHDEEGDTYSLVLYPMKCENRRRERRLDIIEFMEDETGDKGRLDLSAYEKDGRFLEGTGSLVLDRIHRIAYISRSERSDIDLAHLWAKKMGYKDVVHFEAFDAESRPVYHTNVLMSIGTHFAIVCLEAISDPQQSSRLMDLLSQDRTVIPITRSQMSCFCGNVLEVMDARDLPVLLMSTQAFHAFDSEQIDVMLQHVSRIHHSAIDTIERIGGGGLRCMIAEIF